MRFFFLKKNNCCDRHKRFSPNVKRIPYPPTPPYPFFVPFKYFNMCIQ